MHGLRKSPRFTRWLLALVLVLSPLFSVWQGGVVIAAPAASAPEQHQVMSAGDHCMQHAGMPVDGTRDHCPGCQHAACHGSCCVGCGHCTAAFGLAVSLAVPAHAILTPRITRLRSSDVLTLRERPPRALHA